MSTEIKRWDRFSWMGNEVTVTRVAKDGAWADIYVREPSTDTHWTKRQPLPMPEGSVRVDQHACDRPDASRLGDQCRCLVCSRCHRHTGNTTQGHYWGFCKVTGTVRQTHFCCPGSCQLEVRRG
jgi:hypothetical protein